MSTSGKKKRAEKETLGESLEKLLLFFLQLITTFYMLLMFVVLPFYFTNGNQRIGTDKFIFFRNISQKMVYPFGFFVVLWLIAYLCIGKWKQIRISLTDCFVVFYGASVVLSYYCSNYREQALWGAQGWYMGLFTQLVLVGIYFGVSRFWKRGDRQLVPIFGAAFVEFGLGILNRFGVYPIDMGVTGDLFISTIGNINWFCGYLVCLLFFGVGLLYEDDGKRRIYTLLLYAFLAIGFGALIVQGSASGFLALAGVFLVMYVLSCRSVEKMLLVWRINAELSSVAIVLFLLRKVFSKSFAFTDDVIEVMTNSPFPFIWLGISLAFCYGLKRWKNEEKLQKWLQKSKGLVIVGSVGIAGLFVVGLTVNTLSHGALSFLPQGAFTFSNEWGSMRGVTWRAGAGCFWNQDFMHKLVGVGPDSMYMYLYFDAPNSVKEMLKECFGGAFLTNAHCEWLTILADIGILGLLGFGGMMISAVVRLLKNSRGNGILCGVAFSLIAYFCNNLFSFQQICGVTYIFILLGMGERCLREKNEQDKKQLPKA